jgi:hypothetical protein
MNYMESFKAAPPYEKREMLKRSVWMVEVDADQKAVRCYVRQLPFANRAAEVLLGEVEKAKLATDHQLPVRIDEVPGTGDSRD